MKQLLQIAVLTLVIGGLGSCTPGPRPIDYGTDACHFCRMTIVDRQHAAEMVTDKGKVYKFDAVECMVNSREEIGADNIALYLCNHYEAPGELIDATTAGFLVSEAMPSPMGANLTAYATIEAATAARQEHGGEVFNWEALLSYLKSKHYVYHL